MSAPYVCPSCRRNAVRHAAALRRLPRTSKVTFISFGPNNPRQSPAKEASATANASNTENLASPGDAQPSQGKHILRHAQRSPRPVRADALSSLFNVIKKSDRYSHPHTADQPSDKFPKSPHNRPPQPKPPQTVPVASQLQEILQNPAKTSSEAWEYFQRHYTSLDCPALRSPHLQDVHRVVTGSVFRRLHMDLLNDWCAGKSDGSVPAPVEVVRRYIDLGIMKPEVWQEVIWNMNIAALKKSNAGAGTQSGTSLAEIMTQMMTLWDLTFQHCGTSSVPAETSPSSSIPMWSSLPPLAIVRQSTRPYGNFSARLRVFLPQLDPQKSSHASHSALITFDLLTRDEVESVLDQAIVAKFRPFIVFLAYLIPGSTRFPTSNEDSSAGLQRWLEKAGVSPKETTALLTRTANASSKAMTLIGSSGGKVFSGGGSLDGVHTRDESLHEFYLKRIARAYSERKRAEIYDLWLEACQKLPRQKNNPKRVPKMMPELYNLTLEALMGMRQPEAAIDVWNKMIEHGTAPTIATWTAMITGCGKARDIQGLEQMWNRMLGSGFQPDVYAWSARISGIMGAGKIDHGLRVLQEMGITWVEACRRLHSTAKQKGGQVDHDSLPPRPNTVILNGAVTALAHMPRRNQQYLARVLAWARSFEIQPDVFTYNSLISIAINTGNVEEAMKLLQQMEKVNVQPDIATFTIILNAVFRRGNTTALSPEEQNRKVMTVLQNLESRGIEANAHIYSTLIDGLLKSYGNEQAARAVLSLMTAKRIVVPAHIYTTLIQYYFQHSDFDAVDALWQQIQKSETVPDVIFYDRMIERYAAIGDTDKMIDFLERMSKQGLTPGWPALQAAVVKLADVGDWARFEEIVYQVENGVGIAKKGLRDSNDNLITRFWKAVAYKRKQKPTPESEQSVHY